MVRALFTTKSRGVLKPSKIGKAFSSDVTGDGPRDKKQVKKQRKRARNATKRIVSLAASSVIGPDATKLARSVAANAKRALKPKSGITLGKCATSLLRSYSRPFDPAVRDVCLPIPPYAPTMKVRGYLRGVGFIGAAGVGFLAISPTTCNDLPTVYYTKADYGRSQLAAPVSDKTLPAQASGGPEYPANACMRNLPFGFESFRHGNTVDTITPVVRGRIASCTARLSYTGTKLNQSGLLMAYNDPADLNILGDAHTSTGAGNGYYDSQIMSFLGTEIEHANKEIVLPIIPSDMGSDDFPIDNLYNMEDIYPYCGAMEYVTADAAAARAGVATAVIMITGVAGSSFFFEVVTNVEYKGTGVASSLLTDVDSDYSGYTTVKDLVVKARRLAQATPEATFSKCLDQIVKRKNISFSTKEYSVLR